MFNSNASTASDDANYIENVFSTYLYTGTGATLSINNGIDLATKGGMVWLKSRSNAFNNYLCDTARGITNYVSSNNVGAQNFAATVTDMIASTSTTGFVLGAGATLNGSNGSGQTQVAWTFREQAKFFDTVTFTTDASGNATVSHNLASTPGCVLIKKTSGSQDWKVYHRGTEVGGFLAVNRYLELNSTGAAVSSTGWITVSSTQISFPGTRLDGSADYVAYLFAHDAGGFGLTGTDNVISCGSYTGAYPSTVTVELGFEPQFILVKNATTASDWFIYDTTRSMDYTIGGSLAPNASSTENGASGAAHAFSPTATGFIVDSGLTAVNVSGNTHLYVAIRRGPMKVPTSGTSVFTPIVTGSSAINLTDSYSSIGFSPDMTLRYQTGTDTSGTLKNAVYTRLLGINSVSGNTPTSGNNPNLLTHSTDVEATTYYYQQDGSMGINYGGSWSAPAYVLNHMHFKRAPGFFDVVCFTGNGSTNRTVTHNLGVAPQLIIVKSRNLASTAWAVWHVANGVPSVIYLQSTAQKATSSGYFDTAPTSSLFYVSGSAFVNEASYTYVSYLFATLPGVSKVGSYTGTGTTQVINCGFTAGSRFVLIKRTDASGDWYAYDSARGIVAGNDPYVLLNSTAAQVTSTDYVDTASSGFELSSTAPAGLNASGGSYIFLAIA